MLFSKTIIFLQKEELEFREKYCHTIDLLELEMVAYILQGNFQRTSRIRRNKKGKYMRQTKVSYLKARLILGFRI